MKLYVTIIYFSCAAQAGVLAAERIEQFSEDCRVSDTHTEEVLVDEANE